MSELEAGIRSGPHRKPEGSSDGRLAFYREWLSSPRRVGALAPTSTCMARKMVSAIRPGSGLPILELGPGTGVITKAILECGVAPDNLVSIEYSQAFLSGLMRNYPGVNFIHGDAFDLTRHAADLGIERFDTVISALPLMTMPIGKRVHLVEAALDLLAPERPMVQFSYMPRPPAPAQKGCYTVSHLATVVRNFPPARIWAYRRPAETNRLSKSSIPVVR